jgi:hypothetical protein
MDDEENEISDLEDNPADDGLNKSNDNLHRADQKKFPKSLEVNP